MYIVKYTTSRWRNAALRGESLRIGSVLYYREIADERFRDAQEGDGKIIHAAKAPLTAEVHNKIFVDQPYRLAEGWTIDTGGVQLHSEPSQFNAFVFSCSLLKRNRDIPKHAAQFGLDSWFFIADPLRFADDIAARLKLHLLATLRGTNMPPSAKKKFEMLEVLPVFGLVKYTTESKDRMVTDENISTFDPRALHLEPFFRKEPKFAEEQEFRFVWLINLGSIERNDFDMSYTTIRTVNLLGPNHAIVGKPRSLPGVYDRIGRRVA